MGTAKRGVPKNTTSPFADARQFLDLADDQILLQTSEAVDEDGALEVIHLVLEAAGQQSCCFDDLLLTIAVSPLTTARDGRASVALKPGTLRQPSSSSCMPSRSTNSGLMNVIRIGGVAPDRDVGHENPQRHTDLRCRETDARRRIHRLDHVVDEAQDVGVISATGVAGRCSTSAP